MNTKAPHSPSTLLQTKLLVPRIPSESIRRPRLVSHLAQGLERALILVAAPAGFGKTTALSQWLVETELPVAWLSLDEHDNDPARFWPYVVAALESLHPDVGKASLSMLQAPQPPPDETILTALLNDLILIPDDFVLALDDYHVIEHPNIHKGITFLLENAPPQMHLAITSRTGPPFPLPLWRARRQLVELDADELRFTAEEVADFLTQVTDLELTVEQVEALETATEGWIAGLQLAALSMEGQEDLESFIRSFSGSHRYVFDYLAQEILDQQHPAVQRFLVETSILERLSGPLCEAVVGEEEAGGISAQAMLERLEAGKLFIVPLDEERRWYRYHNLFREFLQARLAQSMEGREIVALHRRAAGWYAGRHLVDAALHHTLAAEDFEDAAQLLVQYEEDFFARSALLSLAGWIEALPTALLDDRPQLLMIYAWATLATGQFERTDATLSRIEETVGATTEALLRAPEKLPPEQRNPLLEVAIIRTSTGMVFFDLEKVQRIAERLLPYLRSEDTRCLHNTTGELRPVLVLNLALAYEFSGQLDAAVPAFREALETGLEQGNMHIVPLALGHLGQLQATQGQLREAEKTYVDAVRHAEEMSPVPSPLAGNAYAGLGQLHYQWNHLERAREYLEAGIALGKPWNSWESLLPGYIGLARIHGVHHRWEAAFKALEKLKTVCREAQMEMLLPTVELAEIQLEVDRGNLDAVAQWARRSDLETEVEAGFGSEAEAIGHVRVLSALGRHAEALEILERQLPLMEAENRWGQVLEARVLQALVLDGQGGVDRALEVLDRALILGEPEGYMRVFLDEGVPMAKLLRRIEPEASKPAYVGRILKAYEEEPVPETDRIRSDSQAPAETGQRLIEHLTDREMDVLHHLAEGLTNPEIAERLTISLNTVKTHTKNIYGKLNVHNRTEAVLRAQELGLLND